MPARPEVAVLQSTTCWIDRLARRVFFIVPKLLHGHGCAPAFVAHARYGPTLDGRTCCSVCALASCWLLLMVNVWDCWPLAIG